MATIALGVARDDGGAAVRVRLRGLCGADELAVDGINTQAAVRLLEDLVNRGGGGPPAVDAMCASDRDRLLAAVYRHAFGDTIQASPACTGCGARFDVSFSLSALQQNVESGRGPGAAPVRPPIASEEIDAGEQSWDEGLALLRAASHDASSDQLDAFAPLIDLDLEAACPECGAAQPVGFDIQSFLLRRLINERPLLVQEVHLLASTYHWPLSDILQLSRVDRQALVAAIDDERGRRVQALRGGRR